MGLQNPASIFQMMNLWNKFKQNHPKFPKFLEAAIRSPIREGTVLEVKIVHPDGESIASNIRVTGDDMELYQQIKDIVSGG